MKMLGAVALACVLAVSFTAKADHWDDDEDGDGRGYSHGWNRGERKVEFDDGRCWVQQKWGEHGEYKEKRKCRGGGYGSSYPPYGYGSSYPPQEYVPYGYGYYYR